MDKSLISSAMIICYLLFLVFVNAQVIQSQSPTISPTLAGGCSSVVIDTKQPYPYGCHSPCTLKTVDAPSTSPTIVYKCEDTNICDVPLNYSLASPYGCNKDYCIVKKDDSNHEICAQKSFLDYLNIYYWGLGGAFQFGYLFWNLALGTWIIFMMQYSSRLIGWALTKFVNGFVLDRDKEAIKIQTCSVAIIGGRASLQNIEYLNASIHVKILELSLSILWWRGEDKVMTPTQLLSPQQPKRGGDPNVNSNTINRNHVRYPYRMSVYVTGLEVSVYNNTGKYEYLASLLGKRASSNDNADSESSKGKGGDSSLDPLLGHNELNSGSSTKFVGTDATGVNINIANGDSQSAQDRQKRDQRKGESSGGTIDSKLPRFYSLFPVTCVELTQSCFYIGAPTLPTTMIVHVKTAVGLHFADEIPIDALNFNVDLYRIINKFDLQGVTVSSKLNKGYIAQEQMMIVRKRMDQEKDLKLHARKAFSRFFKGIRTGVYDVKLGVQDVLADTEQTLRFNKGKGKGSFATAAGAGFGKREGGVLAPIIPSTFASGGDQANIISQQHSSAHYAGDSIGKSHEIDGERTDDLSTDIIGGSQTDTAPIPFPSAAAHFVSKFRTRSNSLTGTMTSTPGFARRDESLSGIEENSFSDKEHQDMSGYEDEGVEDRVPESQNYSTSIFDNQNSGRKPGTVASSNSKSGVKNTTTATTTVDDDDDATILESVTDATPSPRNGRSNGKTGDSERNRRLSTKENIGVYHGRKNKEVKGGNNESGITSEEEEEEEDEFDNHLGEEPEDGTVGEKNSPLTNPAFAYSKAPQNENEDNVDISEDMDNDDDIGLEDNSEEIHSFRAFGTILSSSRRLDSLQQASYANEVNARGSSKTGLRMFRSRGEKARPMPEPDILVTDKLEIIYFFDQPGEITEQQVLEASMNKDNNLSGNAGNANTSSTSSSFHGPRNFLGLTFGSEAGETIVNYGPWADRQRSLFMNHFFPFAYENLEMFTFTVGKMREALQFELTITFRGDVSFRIPYITQKSDLMLDGGDGSIGGPSGVKDFDEANAAATKNAKGSNSENDADIDINEMNGRYIPGLGQSTNKPLGTSNDTIWDKIQKEILKIAQNLQEKQNQRSKWTHAENRENVIMEPIQDDGWLIGPMTDQSFRSEEESISSFYLPYLMDPSKKEEFQSNLSQIMRYQEALVAVCRSLPQSTIMQLTELKGGDYSDRFPSTSSTIGTPPSPLSLPSPEECARVIWRNFIGDESRLTELIPMYCNDPTLLNFVSSSASTLPVSTQFTGLLDNLRTHLSKFLKEGFDRYFPKLVASGTEKKVVKNVKEVRLLDEVETALNKGGIVKKISGPLSGSSSAQVGATVTKDDDTNLRNLVDSMITKMEFFSKNPKHRLTYLLRENYKDELENGRGYQKDRFEAEYSNLHGSNQPKGSNTYHYKKSKKGKHANDQVPFQDIPNPITRRDKGNKVVKFTGHRGKQFMYVYGNHTGPLGAAVASGSYCGWLDVHGSADSSFKMSIPWYATSAQGEATTFTLDIKNPTLSSTATHSKFLVAPSGSIRGRMHYPIQWNAKNTWEINISFQSPKVFLLRSHVSTLADLGADWGSNAQPEPSVLYFIPYTTIVRINMTDADWYFNCNENNVISFPDDPEANSFFAIHVPQISAKVSNHAHKFQAPDSTWEFTAHFDSNTETSQPCQGFITFPKDHPRRMVPLSTTSGGPTSSSIATAANRIFDYSIYGSRYSGSVNVYQTSSMQGGLSYGGNSNLKAPDLNSLNALGIVEMSKAVISGSYSYYTHVGEGNDYSDFISLTFDFESTKFNAYPEAVVTLLRFTDNYLGWNIYPVSGLEYCLSGERNLKSLLALREWVETLDNHAKLILYNDSDSQVKFNLNKVLLIFPIAIYPTLSVDGQIQDPEKECILVHTNEISCEMRAIYGQFAETSASFSPLNIQFPILNILPSSTNETGGPSSTNATSSTARQWFDYSGDRFNPRKDNSQMYGNMRSNQQQSKGKPLYQEVKEFSGHILIDGMRIHEQFLYGRAPHPLFPVVPYVCERKANIGVIHGDIAVPQISQLIDALNSFDTGYSRMFSSDQANGGVRDPFLSSSLPRRLAKIQLKLQPHVVVDRASISNSSPSMHSPAHFHVQIPHMEENLNELSLPTELDEESELEARYDENNSNNNYNENGSFTAGSKLRRRSGPSLGGNDTLKSGNQYESNYGRNGAKDTVDDSVIGLSTGDTYSKSPKVAKMFNPLSGYQANTENEAMKRRRSSYGNLMFSKTGDSWKSNIIGNAGSGILMSNNNNIVTRSGGDFVIRRPLSFVDVPDNSIQGASIELGTLATSSNEPKTKGLKGKSISQATSFNAAAGSSTADSIRNPTPLLHSKSFDPTLSASRYGNNNSSTNLRGNNNNFSAAQATSDPQGLKKLQNKKNTSTTTAINEIRNLPLDKSKYTVLLCLTIVGARNLPSFQKNSKRVNAWVQARFGSQSFSTQIVPDKSHPEWTAEYDFQTLQNVPVSDLVLNVFDGSYGMKKFMGEVILPSVDLQKIVEDARKDFINGHDYYVDNPICERFFSIDASKADSCYTTLRNTFKDDTGEGFSSQLRPSQPITILEGMRKGKIPAIKLKLECIRGDYLPQDEIHFTRTTISSAIAGIRVQTGNQMDLSAIYEFARSIWEHQGDGSISSLAALGSMGGSLNAKTQAFETGALTSHASSGDAILPQRRYPFSSKSTRRASFSLPTGIISSGINSSQRKMSELNPTSMKGLSQQPYEQSLAAYDESDGSLKGLFAAGGSSYVNLGSGSQRLVYMKPSSQAITCAGLATKQTLSNVALDVALRDIMTCLSNHYMKSTIKIELGGINSFIRTSKSDAVITHLLLKEVSFFGDNSASDLYAFKFGTAEKAPLLLPSSSTKSPPPRMPTPTHASSLSTGSVATASSSSSTHANEVNSTVKEIRNNSKDFNDIDEISLIVRQLTLHEIQENVLSISSPSNDRKGPSASPVSASYNNKGVYRRVGPQQQPHTLPSKYFGHDPRVTVEEGMNHPAFLDDKRVMATMEENLSSWSEIGKVKLVFKFTLYGKRVNMSEDIKRQIQFLAVHNKDREQRMQAKHEIVTGFGDPSTEVLNQSKKIRGINIIYASPEAHGSSDNRIHRMKKIKEELAKKRHEIMKGNPIRSSTMGAHILPQSISFDAIKTTIKSRRNLAKRSRKHNLMLSLSQVRVDDQDAFDAASDDGDDDIGVELDPDESMALEPSSSPKRIVLKRVSNNSGGNNVINKNISTMKVGQDIDTEETKIPDQDVTMDNDDFDDENEEDITQYHEINNQADDGENLTYDDNDDFVSAIGDGSIIDQKSSYSQRASDMAILTKNTFDTSDKMVAGKNNDPNRGMMLNEGRNLQKKISSEKIESRKQHHSEPPVPRGNQENETGSKKDIEESQPRNQKFKVYREENLPSNDDVEKNPKAVKKILGIFTTSYFSPLPINGPSNGTELNNFEPFLEHFVVKKSHSVSEDLVWSAISKSSRNSGAYFKRVGHQHHPNNGNNGGILISPATKPILRSRVKADYKLPRPNGRSKKFRDVSGSAKSVEPVEFDHWMTLLASEYEDDGKYRKENVKMNDSVADRTKDSDIQHSIIHVTALKAVEFMVTQLSIAAAEEAIQDFFPINPSIPQLVDFYQRNYLLQPKKQLKPHELIMPTLLRSQIQIFVPDIHVRLIHLAMTPAKTNKEPGNESLDPIEIKLNDVMSGKYSKFKKSRGNSETDTNNEEYTTRNENAERPFNQPPSPIAEDEYDGMEDYGDEYDEDQDSDIDEKLFFSTLSSHPDNRTSDDPYGYMSNQQGFGTDTPNHEMDTQQGISFANSNNISLKYSAVYVTDLTITKCIFYQDLIVKNRLATILDLSPTQPMPQNLDDSSSGEYSLGEPLLQRNVLKLVIDSTSFGISIAKIPWRGSHKGLGLTKRSYFFPVFNLVASNGMFKKLSTEIQDDLHILGRGGVLTNDTELNISNISFKASVIAGYPLFSSLSNWSESLTSLIDESAAIWYRKRHQWAYLAGKILQFWQRVENAHLYLSSREKEDRYVLDLWAWMKAHSLVVGMDDSTLFHPGWNALMFLRKMICYLPDKDLIEAEIAAIELDRYPEISPISMEIVAAAASMLHIPGMMSSNRFGVQSERPMTNLGSATHQKDNDPNNNFFGNNPTTTTKVDGYVKLGGTGRERSFSKFGIRPERSAGALAAIPREADKFWTHELLIGISNSSVVRKPRLREETNQYHIKLDHADVEIYDVTQDHRLSSAQKRTKDLHMIPAQDMCMLLEFKPTLIEIRRNAFDESKNFPTGKNQHDTTIQSMNESDLQYSDIDSFSQAQIGKSSSHSLRYNRLSPKRIVIYASLVSAGVDWLSSPELVLATRAITNIAKRYSEIALLLQHERQHAKDSHEKEISRVRAMVRNQYQNQNDRPSETSPFHSLNGDSSHFQSGKIVKTESGMIQVSNFSSIRDIHAPGTLGRSATPLTFELSRRSTHDDVAPESYREKADSVRSNTQTGSISDSFRQRMHFDVLGNLPPKPLQSSSSDRAFSKTIPSLGNVQEKTGSFAYVISRPGLAMQQETDSKSASSSNIGLSDQQQLQGSSSHMVFNGDKDQKLQHQQSMSIHSTGPTSGIGSINNQTLIANASNSNELRTDRKKPRPSLSAVSGLFTSVIGTGRGSINEDMAESDFATKQNLQGTDNQSLFLTTAKTNSTSVSDQTQFYNNSKDGENSNPNIGLSIKIDDPVPSNEQPQPQDAEGAVDSGVETMIFFLVKMDSCYLKLQQSAGAVQAAMTPHQHVQNTSKNETKSKSGKGMPTGSDIKVIVPLHGFEMNWTRILERSSNSISLDTLPSQATALNSRKQTIPDSFRDFVLVTFNEIGMQIESVGRRGSNGISDTLPNPWAITFACRNCVLNIITSREKNSKTRGTTKLGDGSDVLLGEGNLESTSLMSTLPYSATHTRVFFNSGNSVCEIPLFKIDNNAIKRFLDEWIRVYTVAAEHAEHIFSDANEGKISNKPTAQPELDPRINMIDPNMMNQGSKKILQMQGKHDLAYPYGYTGFARPQSTGIFYSHGASFFPDEEELAQEMKTSYGSSNMLQPLWTDVFDEYIQAAHERQQAEDQTNQFGTSKTSGFGSELPTSDRSKGTGIGSVAVQGPGVTKRMSTATRLTTAAINSDVPLPVRLVATFRFQKATAVLQPVKSVVIKYTVNKVTSAMDRRSSESIDCLVYFGRSIAVFEVIPKAPSYNSSSPSRSTSSLSAAAPPARVNSADAATRNQNPTSTATPPPPPQSSSIGTYQQRLPRAWIIGNLSSNSSKADRNDSEKKRLLESKSLRTEDEEEYHVVSPSDSPTILLKKTIMKGTPPSVPRMGSDGRRQNSSEIFDIRVKVLVESIQNTITPSIFHHFLALQGSLASEINLILDSVERLAEEYSKARKKRLQKLAMIQDQRNKVEANSTTSPDRIPKDDQRLRSPSIISTPGLSSNSVQGPKFRYSLHFFLHGICLRAMSHSPQYGIEKGGHARGENVAVVIPHGPWVELKTGAFIVSLKSDKTNDISVPKTDGSSDMLQITAPWIAKVNFNDLTFNLFRRKKGNDDIRNVDRKGISATKNTNSREDHNPQVLNLFKLQTNICISNTEEQSKSNDKSDKLPTMSPSKLRKATHGTSSSSADTNYGFSPSGGKDDTRRPNQPAMDTVVSIVIEKTGMTIRPNCIQEASSLVRRYQTAFDLYCARREREIRIADSMSDGKGDNNNPLTRMDFRAKKVWQSVKSPLKTDFENSMKEFLANDSSISKNFLRVVVKNSSFCAPYISEPYGDGTKGKVDIEKAAVHSKNSNISCFVSTLEYVELFLRLDTSTLKGITTDSGAAFQTNFNKDDPLSLDPSLLSSGKQRNMARSGMIKTETSVTGRLVFKNLLFSLQNDGDKFISDPWTPALSFEEDGPMFGIEGGMFSLFSTLPDSYYQEIEKRNLSSNEIDQMLHSSKKKRTPINVSLLLSIQGIHSRIDPTIIRSIDGIQNAYLHRAIMESLEHIEKDAAIHYLRRESLDIIDMDEEEQNEGKVKDFDTDIGIIGSEGFNTFMGSIIKTKISEEGEENLSESGSKSRKQTHHHHQQQHQHHHEFDDDEDIDDIGYDSDDLSLDELADVRSLGVPDSRLERALDPSKYTSIQLEVTGKILPGKFEFQSPSPSNDILRSGSKAYSSIIDNQSQISGGFASSTINAGSAYGALPGSSTIGGGSRAQPTASMSIINPRLDFLNRQRQRAGSAVHGKNIPEVPKKIGIHTSQSETGENDTKSTNDEGSDDGVESMVTLFEIPTPNIIFTLHFDQKPGRTEDQAKKKKAKRPKQTLKGSIHVDMQKIEITPTIILYLEHMKSLTEKKSIQVNDPNGYVHAKSNYVSSSQQGYEASGKNAYWDNNTPDDDVFELNAEDIMCTPEFVTIVSISIKTFQFKIRAHANGDSGVTFALPKGVGICISNGPVIWDEQQSLRVASVNIPVISLTVYEKNPFVDISIYDTQFNVNQAAGVLNDKMFHTILLMIGKSHYKLDLWKLDKMTQMIESWKVAWANAEKIVKSSFSIYLKNDKILSPSLAEQKVGTPEAMVSTATQYGTDARKYSQNLRPNSVKVKPNDASSKLPSSSRVHGESMTIFVSSFVKETVCEVNLGMLASTAHMSFASTSIRIGLPGQASGERSIDPDTVCIRTHEINAIVSGRYEGILSLSPGIYFMLSRDKKSVPLSVKPVSWQPWFSQKTALNEVSLDIGEIHLNLARDVRIHPGDHHHLPSNFSLDDFTIRKSSSQFISFTLTSPGIKFKDIIGDSQDADTLGPNISACSIDAKLTSESLNLQLSTETIPILREITDLAIEMVQSGTSYSSTSAIQLSSSSSQSDPYHDSTALSKFGSDYTPSPIGGVHARRQSAEDIRATVELREDAKLLRWKEKHAYGHNPETSQAIKSNANNQGGLEPDATVSQKKGLLEKEQYGSTPENEVTESMTSKARNLPGTIQVIQGLLSVGVVRVRVPNVNLTIVHNELSRSATMILTNTGTKLIIKKVTSRGNYESLVRELVFQIGSGEISHSRHVEWPTSRRESNKKKLAKRYLSESTYLLSDPSSKGKSKDDTYKQSTDSKVKIGSGKEKGDPTRHIYQEPLEMSFSVARKRKSEFGLQSSGRDDNKNNIDHNDGEDNKGGDNHNNDDDEDDNNTFHEPFEQDSDDEDVSKQGNSRSSTPNTIHTPSNKLNESSATVSGAGSRSLESKDPKNQQQQQAGHSSKVVVVSFPESTLNMITQQYFRDHRTRFDDVVHFKFITDFRSPISVSTNAKAYAKLREMYALFTEKLNMNEVYDRNAAASTQYGASGGLDDQERQGFRDATGRRHQKGPSGSIDNYMYDLPPDVTEENLAGVAASYSSSGASVRGKRMMSIRNDSATETDQSDDTREWKQDVRGDKPAFVLQPQLNIMGEATSSVLDWYLRQMGVSIQDLPEQVHKMLIDNLEAFLAALRIGSLQMDDFYQDNFMTQVGPQFPSGSTSIAASATSASAASAAIFAGASDYYMQDPKTPSFSTANDPMIQSVRSQNKQSVYTPIAPTSISGTGKRVIGQRVQDMDLATPTPLASSRSQAPMDSMRPKKKE